MTTHTPEELGCLAGGPARAAEVALARLLHAGLVRVSRDGVVTAVQHHPGRVSPLEAQILSGVRTGRHLNDVLHSAATSPEAAGLRAHLADRGLLRRRRSWRPRLYPWLRLLGVGLLVAGVGRLAAPELVAKHVPQVTGFPLWCLFAAAVLLFVWATVLSARDPGRLRTRAGRRAVRRAAGHVSAHDPVGAVAVRGLRGRIGRLAIAGMVGLTPVAVGMVPHRDTSSSSSCGGGCSSSSCGGDSGGDSGGGGCGGGCGGGGD
ncbi:TIGR04222 domain-containing membrane protein [Lentzea aerocolonigenes]|uniref:TIGR04222 domain-containing membrane protein n=1 Tax=Lentzea aerocolonigenes TaxID=68170 RepID=UPI0004C37673|nr:TIGR04222 domain-containing membrane protein [Lentzea aerocolonigenes]MCP2247142.1 TIGR04222 domain-containing protein [Lentzea aerocolonigenes]